MDIIYLALAATAGGIVLALLGFLDSKEPFDPRKFGASALRALIAGVFYAVGLKLAGQFSAIDLLWAFLTGTGVEVAVNRIAGALGNPTFPLPSPTNPPTDTTTTTTPK